MENIGRDCVAHVLLRAMRSRDVPSTPAFVERRPVVGRRRLNIAEHDKRRPIRFGNCGIDDEMALVARSVATRAFPFPALESRVIGFMHIEGVKRDALRRVQYRQFQHRPVVHITDRHVVVEIDCPRVARPDLVRLETGF